METTREQQNDSFHQSERARLLYEHLTNEEDARACSDISDSACRVTPGNFLLILCSNILTKLGDAITNPRSLLRYALPIDSPEIRQVQDKLEGLNYALRTKQWGRTKREIKQARKLLNRKRDSIVSASLLCA